MERKEFLHTVQTFIEQNHLFTKNDKILVGVSGGVDSMTLIQTLYELEYEVAIAHCNFMLRGDESDGDQNFVVKYAHSRSIPIHVCSFDTRAVAQERKISIEMAARELRYEWFETVCTLNNYTKIAIAHNQNDSIETFFINLLRSAGIKGLTGIPKTNGKVVRPLLAVSRQDIESFASHSSLNYRVDSSNLANDYLRNKIRNIILPELQAISPNCLQAVSTSMSHMQQAHALYSSAIAEKRNLCCSPTDNGFVIDESKLLGQEYASTLLYEFLYPYGFNPTVISQIFDSFGTQAGKTFEADEYIALHDRNCLFVERKQGAEQELIQVQECGAYQLQNEILRFTSIPRGEFVLDKNRSVACVDYDKLTFPLQLRMWRQGDSFVPFGMKGRKKVSDFLIDEKVPLLQKQHVLVLESAGEIVWVVGHRISQLFAVTDKTKTVGKFSLER